MVVEMQQVAPRSPGRRGTAERSSRPTSTDERRGFDRDYWLEHCEGYRVDARDGRLGFVDEVRPQTVGGGPPTLAIRAGRLGRRLLLVSASDVAFIVPRAQRIWLRSPVAIVGTEPLASGGRAAASA